MKKPVKCGDGTIRAYTLVEQHFDEVKALFAEGLNAIDEAMEAERVVLDREGEPLSLGPDYTIRTAAAKLLNELCLRCRKAPVEEPEKEPRLTVESLREIYENNGQLAQHRAMLKAEAKERRRQSKSKSPESGALKENV